MTWKQVDGSEHLMQFTFMRREQAGWRSPGEACRHTCCLCVLLRVVKRVCADVEERMDAGDFEGHVAKVCRTCQVIIKSLWKRSQVGLCFSSLFHLFPSLCLELWFPPTGKVVRLRRKLDSQGFCVIFIKLFQRCVGQNVVVGVCWVAYLHLKQTEKQPCQQNVRLNRMLLNDWPFIAFCSCMTTKSFRENTF